jgi:hypothetical protein
MRLKAKKHKKINILEIPEMERSQVLREARQKLRARIVEEKLLRFLMNSEVLSINGKIVYKSNEPLQGLSVDGPW